MPPLACLVKPDSFGEFHSSNGFQNSNAVLPVCCYQFLPVTEVSSFQLSSIDFAFVVCSIWTENQQQLLLNAVLQIQNWSEAAPLAV
jgi:hypothetical protein